MAQENENTGSGEFDDALDFDGDTLGGDVYDDEPADDNLLKDEAADDGGDEPIEDTVEETDESTEGEDELEASTTVTIDGKKYSVDDLTPELVSKMATHYNQVGHFQKIAEERDKAIAERDAKLRELESRNRQVVDEWAVHKMQQEQAASRREKEQREQESVIPRPSTQQLSTAFKPYLDKLVEEGRLTLDEVDEHSGLVAEYLFDTYSRDQRTSQEFQSLQSRLEHLENFVSPAVTSWDQRTAIERDASIRDAVSKMEGYEELQDPQNWEKLKGYVTQKIMNSPKDAEGNPLFDPLFDAETMAEQWDAMTAKVMRKALAQKRTTAGSEAEADKRRAGGSAASGGQTPRRKAGKKGPATPEDDALDFTDNRRATA